jgi:hypothetical protein
MENSELQFSDLRFEDFITNHYPDIRSKLEDFIRRSLDVNNKKGDLCNKLDSKLSNVFDNLEQHKREFQVINSESKDTLIRAILSHYDKSFLRITNYGESQILYFYPVEYKMIPFKDNSYRIFSSALSDEGANSKSVNDKRSCSESNTAFIDSRNRLLKRLMALKYSTKLNFEKKWIRRRRRNDNNFLCIYHLANLESCFVMSIILSRSLPIGIRLYPNII